MPGRRKLLQALAALAPVTAAPVVLAPLAPALAQTAPYPNRPIRLIVPYPPGGLIDLLGRSTAEFLPPRLGQPVVVENLPGASTIVGAQAVSRAAPDGYTLLIATSTTLAVVPTLYRPRPFDPVREFTAVACIAATCFVLVVRTADGPRTLAELIERARANPGSLTYGSSGIGTPHHIGFELLRGVAGFEAMHVPYRGTAASLPDLLGGRIGAMFADIPPALEHIRAGTLRALAVLAPARIEQLPDVPTLSEVGLNEANATGWAGVVGPPGLPAPIVQRLSDAIIQAFGDPAGQARLAALSMPPVLKDAAAFAAFIPAELARWAPIIQASGARVE